MLKELLLEIGTEEIPSVYLNPAIGKIEELTKKLFAENRVSHGQIKVFGSPRRLILFVENLSDRQESITSKVIGPPKRVSFNEKGLPTQAAVGFAKNQGIRVEDLNVEKTEKGEYLCAVKEEKGEATKKILPDILPKLIFSIPFPKHMRWGDGNVKFVRPVHWILCLYNGDVVKFEFDSVKSGNKSFGHRFLSPKTFTVKDFASYGKKTKENYIIFNQEDRRETILKEANKLAKKAGGSLYEDANLLEAVTHLVEYPCPILGEFGKEYLELPKEVLISVMKKHQRYFSIVNSNGSLLPNFIAISNNKVKNPAVMKAGYERVLKARFSDARFFYEEDKKKPLKEYIEKLKSVVFQEKLGTYYEKVERIVKLACYIADKIAPDSKEISERGAFLCKADLVTQMVYEFPDLQGIMGREYARLSGEKQEVADAIYEHYLPRFAGDKLPDSRAGDIVSIADKIDTIIGCFGVGLIPTGSEDPYALRRQTLAIANIILGKSYQISVSDLIDRAMDIAGQKIERGRGEVKNEVIDFFKSRLKNQLVSDGFSYDVVDAVFSARFNDILDAVNKVKALSELKTLEYFSPLAIAFKRAANIIKENKYGSPDPALLKEDAEKELYDSFNSIKSDVEKLVEEKMYLDAMKKIAEIRGSVDKFFDKVMVMVEDKSLRENRLNLLSNISKLYGELADFTKIIIVK
ncbi:MAG: glycine--tRNA ligase subunit beta [Nitrospinae bacterium RIFCSPLOWO2_12_39_16]|nr:MAG: glycine--tRNA ligase subunit beta [Nitrospinae bacterium RIFCSPLOWO2_12_39_16]